jgi:hypothetical protein
MKAAGLALTLLAFAFAPTASAAQDPPSTVRIVYGLRIGFLPLGKMDLTQQMHAGDYKADSHLETAGLINLFWKSKIEAHSKGAVERDRLAPAVYDSRSVNHSDKNQRVSLTYGRNTLPVLFASPPYKTKKYPVSDEQKKNTLDPVSALVLMTTGLSASAQNPCGTKAPVFDGARRYDVVLDYKKTENITLANGLYSGPVYLCQIHYNQIAGFKQKILEEGKKLPDMFAWMAALPARNDSRAHYIVPLRIWTATGFGTVEALASRVNLNGNVWKEKS